jgi:hypothetical protein
LVKLGLTAALSQIISEKCQIAIAKERKKEYTYGHGMKETPLEQLQST